MILLFMIYWNVVSGYIVTYFMYPFWARWSLYVPPGLTFTNPTFCPHSVFVCFVWIWEQTAIISLYSINWLVCITETECVYCAIRAGSLYIIQVMCFVWIWEQTAIISLYSINWLVFITETNSVSCAVRTDCLNVIQVNFSNWQHRSIIHSAVTLLYQTVLMAHVMYQDSALMFFGRLRTVLSAERTVCIFRTSAMKFKCRFI